MNCPNCNTPCKVYRQINKSGSVVVVERCPECRSNPTPQRAFLPKSEYKVEDLPLFEDYTKDAPQCDVRGCRNVGVEYHHYAPRHLFDDADDWATGWLCREHHTLWHERTQTGMFYKRSKVK